MFLHRNLPPSPYINRFVQPDTLIPDLSNPQSWNRYSYVTNRPVNFNDPTGHSMDDGCKDYGCDFGTSSSTFSSSSYTPVSTGGDPDVELSSAPTYDDGLKGLPVAPTPSHGVFNTSFQMFLVTDPYYYGQAADETYTGFTGSGDLGGSTFDLFGLANDALLGYRPTYLRNHTPYDQNVSLMYINTYQGIPRIDAQRIVTLTNFSIQNNSSMGRVINYFAVITSRNVQSVSTTTASPGQTVNIGIPSNLNLSTGGINVSITAFTGCTGACISTRNPVAYRGYINFNFSP